MTQVYIIMGCAGSGRMDVVTDLASWCAQDGSVAAIAVAEGDTAVPDGFQSLTWSLDQGAVRIGEIPENVDTLFLLLDGKGDPADQMEALSHWFASRPDVELARILTVLNSSLLSGKPEYTLWFDACVHFSDMVLFACREGVTNKWFSDYKKRFQSQFFPCLFEFVKNGKVTNPAEVLYPEARRMSLAFDSVEPDMETASALEDGTPIIDETGDDDADPDAEEVQADPYFERDAAGRRKKRLPDIRAAF